MESWNVFHRTINNQHRTNNNIEGWHRGFQATCGTLFPNIYRFINALRQQQHLHNYEIAQMLAGQPPPQRNCRYARISDRARRIALEYENRNHIEYLQSVSHLF